MTRQFPGDCIEDGPDYECQCHAGYQFNDETCADVDECAEEACGNGVCTNTPGSYRSLLYSGFLVV